MGSDLRFSLWHLSILSQVRHRWSLKIGECAMVFEQPRFR